MAEKDQNTNDTKVNASPSKTFFVEMLTRDIELKDAILDLLDNCLDGVLRSLSKSENGKKVLADETADTSKPYVGFKADIHFDKDSFIIRDNCGGMTKEVLMNHAFRLGRPALDTDENLPTVGLYGIGMKRAIFKLGRSCSVTTCHNDKAYRVSITPEWMLDDDLWELKLEELDSTTTESGTTIEVKNLRSEILREFDSNENQSFVNDFKNLLSTHYSYIIQKGFEVNVNKETIKPKRINLKFGKKLAPYIFKGEFDDVSVDLVVGLYRKIPTASEMDSMDESSGFRSEDAGWTVICNDRVVLYNDTSHLTGWGEGNVPKYHTQFIAISGVARFSSKSPNSLPLTTTKRGINLSSPLYAEVKNIMREGTRHFTSFTNKWKSDSKELSEIYDNTADVEPLKATTMVEESSWSKSTKYNGRKYVPVLPTPELSESKDDKISFSRPKTQIQLVAEYLFGNRDIKSSDVGEKCFDEYYKVAKSEIGG